MSRRRILQRKLLRRCGLRPFPTGGSLREVAAARLAGRSTYSDNALGIIRSPAPPILASTLLPVLTIASCILGLLILFVGRSRLAGTTLLVPWAWSVFSLLSIGGVEVGLLFVAESSTLVPVWRYAAAATTLAPGMALLGAKRPQELMWQLATVSLLGIAWIPVMISLVVRPGQALHLPTFLPWVLTATLLYVVVNYLPTRFGAAALVTGIGQSLLLSNAWPIYAQDGGALLAAIGAALISGGIWLAYLDPWRGKNLPHDADRRWLDFRDAYGLAWALRVAERVNQSAERFDWGVSLEWDGFAPADEQREPSEHAWREADLGLRSLLKRFVGKSDAE